MNPDLLARVFDLFDVRMHKPCRGHGCRTCLGAGRWPTECPERWPWWGLFAPRMPSFDTSPDAALTLAEVLGRRYPGLALYTPSAADPTWHVEDFGHHDALLRGSGSTLGAALLDALSALPKLDLGRWEEF